MSGVDKNDRKIGRRGAGGHIACVLFMAWGIGDDEFSFGRREISVGHIDGDALFAFGSETIGHQGRIEFTSGGTVDFAFVFELG